MFLTRKDIKKINGMTVAYCILGVLCLLLSGFGGWDDESWGPVCIGVIAIAGGFLFRPLLRYSVGTAKLVNSGNKLIRKQLRPAEFIRLYIQKRDFPDNVVAKPDFEVLNLLTVAYDVLDDSEHMQDALEQMLAAAPEKKKSYVMLLKAGTLYEKGQMEEAEQLYRGALNAPMDILTKATADVVLKTDRAMALGDYTTAEAYFRQLLAGTFPKQPLLSLLTTHYYLGKICSLTDRPEEAETHLNYCMENSGETAMKAKVADMLNALRA